MDLSLLFPNMGRMRAMVAEAELAHPLRRKNPPTDDDESERHRSRDGEVADRWDAEHNPPNSSK